MPFLIVYSRTERKISGEKKMFLSTYVFGDVGRMMKQTKKLDTKFFFSLLFKLTKSIDNLLLRLNTELYFVQTS